MHCTRVCSLWQVSRQIPVPDLELCRDPVCDLLGSDAQAIEQHYRSLAEGGSQGSGLRGEPSCDMMSRAVAEFLLA